MLPQMMPLPWLMVFFLIFSIFYSVFLFLQMELFSGAMSSKTLSTPFYPLPW